MYISLDRVDIRLKARGGLTPVVQIDHRLPEEIDRRRGLSAIIALIRCLIPLRALGEIELFYNCQHEPPAFLHEVVSACGGRLCVGDDVSVYGQPLPAALPNALAVNRLTNNAMQDLSRAVVAD